MRTPIRIDGFTPKAQVERLRLTKRFELTVDLDGLASIYVDAWDRNKDDAQLLTDLVNGLSCDYFTTMRVESLSAAKFSYFYSARYTDAHLPRICLTLLQLDIKARLVLSVRDDDCSFVIAADRSIESILREYFDDVREISDHRFTKVRQHLVDRRKLVRLSLPKALGISEAAPVAFEVRAEVFKGIELGSILSPLTHKPIGKATIELDMLTRGTTLAGSIGSGKTTTAFSITNQVLAHGIPTLILDPKKEHRAHARTNNARVLGFAEPNLFTFNLLKPVGNPAQWIKEFAQIFAEIISRGVPAEGSKDVIIEELHELYKARGIYDGSTDYPHLGDLLDRLTTRGRSDATRVSNWVASAERVLKSLMVGGTEQAFCVRDGLAIEEFFRGCTVIELDAIGDRSGVALVMSVVLRKLYNFLMTSQDRNRLKILVVLEEAQGVLAREAEASSFLASMCRESRALGMGLVYVTQVPSEFSTHAIANSNTVVAHRLILPEDKQIIGDILSLTTAQVAALETLPPGEAIVRTNKTFLIAVPNVPRPPVRDDELLPERRTREDVAASFPQRGEVARRWNRLSRQERRVFQLVAEGVAVIPSKIATILRCENKEASDLLSASVRCGFLNYLPVHTGKRGHPPHVYFLTPYGEEAYRQHVERYADVKQEPSAKHAEIVAEVVRILGIEPIRPSHPFDILFMKGATTQAIEVETGSNKNEQLRTNFLKSIELQNEAVFVAENERVYNRIFQVLAKEVFDTKKKMTLKIALVTELPHWETFEANPILA